ncbi:MAG: MFS transporter, partial [Candidatus Hydrothermarchaeaceae archaeon]
MKSEIIDFFSLKRNVVVVSGVGFLLSLGEELWSRFIPKYLEALGAGVFAIGLFGALKDLLDAVYQYPGGFVADRFGRKNALVLFSALSLAGYVIYLLAPSYVFIFLGLFFVMSQSSLALPATFAIIGDSLPKERRTMGFTVQSLLKRVPIVIAPPVGGLLIVKYGLVEGVKMGLLITIFFTLFAVIIQRKSYDEPPRENKIKGGLFEQYAKMNASLKKLLLTDILIRLAEGIPKVFLILYIINILGFDALGFGSFIALQMLVSIIVYIPVARYADRFGRKPFVILTFIFFTLFPLAVVLAKSFWLLVIAFVIAGLRETGEPARKALIVDLTSAETRGRQVGLYYLIRSFAVFPASIIGAVLW